MNRIAASAWLLSFAVAPHIFAGPPGDIPLERLVGKSDLIVIGKVITKKGPEKRLLNLPHTEGEVEFACSYYKVTIEQVLFDRKKAIHGNDVTIVARDDSPAPDLQVPQLKEDVAYLFLLQRLPGNTCTFYLPNYYKHYRPATEKRVQAIQQALSAR